VTQPALPAVGSGTADALIQLARFGLEVALAQTRRGKRSSLAPPPASPSSGSRRSARHAAALPASRLCRGWFPLPGPRRWRKRRATRTPRRAERREVAPDADGVFGPVEVEYTLDPALTERVLDILRDVELAHVIVMDPADGRILSYASTERASFPRRRALPDRVADEAGDGFRGAESGARRVPSGRVGFIGSPYYLTQNLLDPPSRESQRRAFVDALDHLEQPVLCAARSARTRQPRRDRPDGAARSARGPPRRASAGEVDPVRDRLELGKLGSGLAGSRISPLTAARLAATLVDGRSCDAVLDRARARRERHGASGSRRLTAPRPVLPVTVASELRSMMVQTTERGTGAPRVPRRATADCSSIRFQWRARRAA